MQTIEDICKNFKEIIFKAAEKYVDNKKWERKTKALMERRI